MNDTQLHLPTVAAHILSLRQDQIHDLISENIRTRQLAPMMRDLNAHVLDGSATERQAAEAALKRLGFL